MIGWKFLPEGGRIARTEECFQPGDIVRIPEGTKPAVAHFGYHASVSILDAMYHAHGITLCKVEGGGEIDALGSIFAASEMRCIERANDTFKSFVAVTLEYAESAMSTFGSFSYTTQRNLIETIRIYLQTGEIRSCFYDEGEKTGELLRGWINSDGPVPNASLSAIHSINYIAIAVHEREKYRLFHYINRHLAQSLQNSAHAISVLVPNGMKQSDTERNQERALVSAFNTLRTKGV